MSTEWLPELLRAEDHDGDWVRFLDAVYDCFRRSFVASRPQLEQLAVAIPAGVREDGREVAFWHIVCGDEGDSPIRERCEHMPWPRPMIDEVPRNRVVRWAEKNRGRRRIYVASADFSYLIVLQDMRKYALLITAYPIARGHTRQKLAKRFQAAQAA